MDTIAQFILANPEVAIIILVMLCLGGLVNVVIILDRRFGLFGTKSPSINDIQNGVNTIKNNHLEHIQNDITTLVAKTTSLQDSFSEMKLDVSEIKKEQIEQGNRLTRVETLISK